MNPNSATLLEPAAAASLHLPDVEPWPEPVDGELLLNDLRALLTRFLVLPQWGAEAAALWSLHTYAFHLRDTTTYLGLESPVKRCGKTTLLNVLRQLVHRPVVAANISPSAFFRVIEHLQPTLLIDEADTVLRKNTELRGILNAGYKRDTAYVVRMANQPPLNHSDPIQPPAPNSHPVAPADVAWFSTWCPKAIAAIGHLPDTLADRCIIIRMHRKSHKDPCERLRDLQPDALRRQCLRFVLDRSADISAARTQLPPELHDRAADIWEPLLVLADLAGGDWPALARRTALALSAQAASATGALLLDLFVRFCDTNADRLFTRDLISHLANSSDRPWATFKNAKDLTERWLADRLREFDIHPRTLRIGGALGKGYLLEDLHPAFRRYITKAELQVLQSSTTVIEPQPSAAANPTPDPSPPLPDGGPDRPAVC